MARRDCADAQAGSAGDQPRPGTRRIHHDRRSNFAFVGNDLGHAAVLLSDRCQRRGRDQLRTQPGCCTGVAKRDLDRFDVQIRFRVSYCTHA
jgi:hypothetical protein